MLSWISGPRLGEDSKEEGNVTAFDAPETPAPVFAVRAFKHALFGTPTPIENDRNVADSEDEVYRGQAVSNNVASSQERKPASGDVFEVEATNVESTPVKPTGILMTPGTGAAKRKTVSFGARSQNSHGGDSRGNPTLDFDQRRSESGLDWRREYEQYALKTKHEMKKLVTKQRLAKSYARQKENEVIQLVGMLRDDRRKAQKLQARTSELEAQMQEYRDALARTKEELEMSKRHKHNANPSANFDHSTRDNLQVSARKPSTQVKTSTKENAVPQNTLAEASPGTPATEGVERNSSNLVARGGRVVSKEKFAQAQKRLAERKKVREMEASRPISFR